MLIFPKELQIYKSYIIRVEEIPSTLQTFLERGTFMDTLVRGIEETLANDIFGESLELQIEEPEMFQESECSEDEENTWLFALGFAIPLE
jgi:hypothetical protein